MTKAARIQDGLIVEVVELPEGFALEECFHPDAGFIEVEGDVKIGMALVKGTFVEAPEQFLTIDDLKAVAARVRFVKETGGITTGGIAINTRREDQAMIRGAVETVTKDPAAILDWKTSDGTFAAMNAAQVEAMADDVHTHIQTCFTTEKSVDEQIDAGTITSIEEIDAIFAAMPMPS